jgi:hypothetical protein
MSPWEGFAPCVRCGKRHRSGAEVDQCVYRAAGLSLDPPPRIETEEEAIDRELNAAFSDLTRAGDFKRERQKTCRLALEVSDAAARIINERRP